MPSPLWQGGASGDRHDHGVDARVSYEITVVIVKRAAISRRKRLALGTVPSTDGDKGRVRQVFHDVTGVARPVLAKADQPDTEHFQMLTLPERPVQTIESLFEFPAPYLWPSTS